MKRSRRWIWLSCVFVLLTGCISSPPPKPETTIPGDYAYTKDYIRWFVQQQMKKHDVTGLSLALIDDQRVVWAEGFGYADKANNIPAKAGTIYRVGSITKLFTATAAMQLIERGLFDLDQPLQTYLPEFTIKTRFPEAAPMTLRHLLTHHSGLPPDVLRGMWSSRSPASYVSVLDDLKETYVLRPPNEIFSYSNVGLTVVGAAIERVSGEPYANYVTRALLQPLGMTSASIDTGVAASPLMSRGYRKGKVTDEPMLRDLPAGGLNASVLDLARLLHMVFAKGQVGEHRIVKADTLAMMLRQQNDGIPLDLDFHVGLGWMLSSLGDMGLPNVGTVAHHGGATWLFHSQLFALPEQQLGVVVLSNSSTSPEAVNTIAKELLKVAVEVKTGMRNEEPKPSVEQPPERLSLDQVAEYEGWYNTMAGLAKVSRSGTDLYADVMGKSLRLVPRNERELGLEYRLLGLLRIDLGELGRVHLSRATVAGHDLLAGRDGSSGRMVVGEKISTRPIPPEWLRRLGTYEIVNLADDTTFLDRIRLSHRDGFLVLMRRYITPETVELTHALAPWSATEATVVGLESGAGEMIEVIQESGEERLRYAGYVLKRTSTE